MKNKKTVKMISVAAAVVLLLVIAAVLMLPKKQKSAGETTDASSKPFSYQIQGLKPILQDKLKAGCETYACTMLLQTLGFDVDEFTIADKYIDCHYVLEAEDGTMYGPDMHSGFAGTPYAGWGVYAPSMAKSMNRYLSDQKSDLKATAYEDVPLETLCEKYIVNDIPVMIWATTDMDPPSVGASWVVDYVDENARVKEGDRVEWYVHEHCLVLIGFDENYYYFGDSTHGTISHFSKAIVEERYHQLGSQCIVVE